MLQDRGGSYRIERGSLDARAELLRALIAQGAGKSFMWHKGQVLDNLYLLLGESARQTHQTLWRARHRLWNVALTIKVNSAASLAQTGEESYRRAANAWINLPLHPNVSQAFYLRPIEDHLCLFAECPGGRDLGAWIQARRAQDWPAILDVAIQLAWAMGHVHRHGPVHGHLAPGHVWVGPRREVKVTDLDLAAFAPEATPYAAPEQRQASRSVDHRADIFSFGVMLWQMLGGRVAWPAEAVAEAHRFVAEAFDRHEVPGLSEGLVQLVRRCVDPDPDGRWTDFGAVAQELCRLHALVVSKSYPRPESGALNLTPEGYNNRALAMLDVGNRKMADRFFEKAVAADPHHPETIYNRDVLRWRGGLLTDVQVVENLEAAGGLRRVEWRPWFLLAQVHAERSDQDGTVAALKEAVARSPDEPQPAEALKAAQAEDKPWARCLRVLQGHTDRVFTVALAAGASPGRYVVLSGGADRTLRRWDLGTGQCQQTFEDNSQVVYTLSLTPDGRTALSGGQEGVLQMWDVSAGRCLRTFEPHPAAICSAALSPDGALAVSADAEGTMRFWETTSGRAVQTIQLPVAAVTGVVDELEYLERAAPEVSVAISGDGRWVLAGGADGVVQVLEAATGRCVHRLEAHQGAVTALGTSRDGRYAISGGMDRQVRLWDLAEGRLYRTLSGHGGTITAVALSGNGRRALTAARDGTLRYWEVKSSRCRRTFEVTGMITSVCLTESGSGALTGGDDKTVCWWKMPPPADPSDFPLALCQPQPLDERAATLVAFSQRMLQAQQAFQDRQLERAYGLLQQARAIRGFERHPQALELWTQLTLLGRRAGVKAVEHRYTLKGHTDKIYSACLTPDGALAVSASEDNSIRVWETATGKCRRVIRGHLSAVSSLWMSEDGQWAVSGSHRHTLRLWEVTSGTTVQTCFGHEDAISAVAMSPDGLWIISGSFDRTVRVWEREQGRCLRVLKGHHDSVLSVWCSRDGRWVLSGSQDKTARLWDLRSAECLRVFTGHHGGVNSAVLSADGRRVLTGSTDGTVRLWDVDTARLCQAFEGHYDSVYCVWLSDDGQWALSGGADRTVRLWSTATGRCLCVLERHTGTVTSVWLSRDGRLILSGGEDETLQLWEVQWQWEFPAPADFDEGARPYLEVFLTQRVPYAFTLEPKQEPTPEQITLALTRRGRPQVEEKDFQALLRTLGQVGYGWLRPEGVREELKKMIAEWRGPRELERVRGRWLRRLLAGFRRAE